MSEERPFPPSARRRQLARRAGLHAASPLLVGAAAATGVVLALGVLGRAAAARIGAAIAAACRLDEPALAPRDVVPAVGSLVLPVLGGALVAAVAAHLAQTRGVWLPRRRVPDAPALARDAVARTRRAGLELLDAAVIGAVAVGWLWLAAPRLARLPVAPLAGAAVIASGLAALATAWVVLGAVDALLRHRELARALRMTAREQREDARQSAGDPRWRERRRQAAREPSPARAVREAAVLVLGDGVAVAIAWDPQRRPVPTRTATGTGARATQLLALARRFGAPVHRDAALAGALATAEGRVPDEHWPRLAEIVAAVRRDRAV